MLNFLFETFRLGIKNLSLHKLRSVLTALGIIVGVAAVIIMVAIGEGAKREAMDQLSQLGARNILVRSVPPPESNDAAATKSRTLDYGIRRPDEEKIETLPDVESIVPLRNTEQKVTRDQTQVVAGGANPIGTTADIFDVVNLHLARGQYFNKLQSDNGEPVCVIGAKIAKQLFPSEDPLHQPLRIGLSGEGGFVLTVIGVLEPTGLRAGSQGAAMMGRDLDMDVYFPLVTSRNASKDTFTKRLSSGFERRHMELTEIWIKARNVEDVEKLAGMATYLVGINQKNGPQDLESRERNDISIKAPIEILRTAERQQRTFNFIMGGIAAFTLMVGGIGIMNIMLATVTERTKEIGIRRALGAKRRHITLQFLIETTVISLMGGLTGIACGVGGAKLLPFVASLFDSQQRYTTAIAMWSVVGSFMASGLIGIGFGLYPAMKAAWMNPIEALRHE